MRTSLRNGLVILSSIIFVGLVLQLAYGITNPDLQWKTSVVGHGRPELEQLSCPKSVVLPNTNSGLFELGEAPQTTIIRHVPGFTIFDGLFMLNGTLFVVSDQSDLIPKLRMMISTGYPLYHGKESLQLREPTPHDMQIISSKEAIALFGPTATRLNGVTFLVNDPPQFINHYYHFCAEVLWSVWRAYSSLDPDITSTGKTSLPSPRRFFFPHTSYAEWQDGPGLNQFILRSVFPSVAIEYEEDWVDRSDTMRPFMFDRLVLADRAAAKRWGEDDDGARYGSPALDLPASPHWWAPIRTGVMEFSRLPIQDQSERPVITYISRQRTGDRRLKDKDHQQLVAALQELEKEQDYEVVIAEMESMTKEEQMRLAGRSTILMGVHGNGLTALIWMQPTPRTSVFEFLIPGGFTLDYQWTAQAMNITHYGFWGSKHFTAPDLPPISYPDGFQGNDIPIDSKAVVALCRKILSGK